MAKQSPDDIEEIAPGTVIDGRYKVVRSIGAGGNGRVYEVEHARTGRKLALKALLDETAFGRLEQEARAASLMKNGHTARIVDMDTGGPTGAYMVMDLLEGQSLRGLLDDAGQLPLELTVNVAMQVCECLNEAHGLGIIHRDLKPENVFLCPSPWPGQYDVKVLDFGVMKIAEAGGAIPKRSLTRTGSTVGTPYYMSLEQLRNASAVDARADVYSLGVVLYECLSGKKPYQADTIGDLVYALCSGPPTQLARIRPDVPAEVAEIVMRTLSANRDDRPSSMLDLAVALLPYANPAFALWVKVDGKQPALARPATSVPPPPMPTVGAASFAAAAPLPPGPSLRDEPRKGGGGGGGRMLTAVLEAAPEPVAPPPAPSRPEVESGRRDTPTEMYVKGVHGADIDDEQSATPRDRDTPTRAIEVGALPPAEDDVPDVPTMDMKGAARIGALPPIPAALATAKLTIPFPNAELPPDPSALAVAPSSSGPKPGWQIALDRALVRVGGFVEAQARAFQAAPQNTKIIVAIVVGTVTILLFGFVLFLATH